MKSKTLNKGLACFMVAAVVATTVAPQSLVYAAELPEEFSDAGNSAFSLGAEPVPAIDEIVTKHTVNIEPSNPEHENTAGTDTNWKLVWSDEFNGGALDTSKWDFQVGNGSEYGVSGWGNNELEYYTDNSENISFEDGNLVITAKKEEKYGSSWTSAKLWTKGRAYDEKNVDAPLFAKKYGRIEAKMTLPKGDGLWPAFWMMPLDDRYGGWAASGEIDIMEARGRLTDSVDGTIHFGSSSPNNKNRGDQYDKEMLSDGAQNFDFTTPHEYAIEWLPGQIKWYVDNECYYTATNWYSTSDGNADEFTYPAPFDQEFFIMLNLAVGGNYDGGRLDQAMTEASMKVDYVRVYDLCDDVAGTVHDYAKDEQTVASPTSAGGGTLMGGNIGDNFLTGALQDVHMPVADPKSSAGESPDNQGWYLMTGTNGAATASGMAEDGAQNGVAKIDVTAAGDNPYSVQLLHQMPLTEGYSYKLTFDAKADAAKNITAQMSDYVYTDYDGSWTKYSDVKNISLTTEWNTYELGFDMKELSDEHTRLELNMGAGGTGAVYVRNAALVATGLSEGISEDADKQPLGNGEHIYNGTFDQGNSKGADGTYTRMCFWNLIGTAIGSVANDKTRSLTLNGSAEGDGIEQKNVQLCAGEGYQLTFDTSADVTVKVVGKSGAVYYEQSVLAGNGQSVTFDVPQDAVDAYGTVQFIVGSGSTVLDNISMIRTSNRGVDWESMWNNGQFYPLDNYDFSKGQDGWVVFNDGAGSWVNNGEWNPYKLEILDKGLHVTAVIPENGASYCVGIETPAFSVKGLIEYKLRLKVTDVKLDQGSDKTKKTLMIAMPDKTMKECQIVPGDNPVIEIPFTASSDIDGAKILIHVGANSAAEYGKYDFVVEYFDFCVDVDVNANNNLPSEYRKKRAPKVTSAGDVALGEDVVVNGSDAWANDNLKVFVENTEIESGKVTVNGGQVKIAGNVFAKDGYYSIRFVTDGYMDVELVQAVGDVAVDAQKPVITAMSPWKTTYTVGDLAKPLTITAKVSDKGTLSYQWYKNQMISMDGMSLIEGATESSYIPDVSTVGSTYYMCIVTNTNDWVANQKTAQVNSEIVSVVVKAAPGGSTTTPGGSETPGGSTVPGGSSGGNTGSGSGSGVGGGSIAPGGSSGGNTGSGSASGEGTTPDEGVTAPDTQTPGTSGTTDGEKIVITGISKKIAAGKKITLAADFGTQAGENVPVIWKSSNEKYATVNADGVVTVKKAGAGKTVKITATAQDGSARTASYKIQIMKTAVQKITLKTEKKSVKAGDQVTVTAKVKADKNANKKLVWKSSNTKYATVNSKGVVTVKKAGIGKTVTITAMATDGSNKKQTVKIKITK